MWDERYSTDEYAYGKEPNDFLRKHAGIIPSGRVLCLAEGEGRNAVYLAGQGYQVTAVDSSLVGLKKAQKLADERGVKIETHHADLEDFDFGLDRWSGIVSIFCHLPAPLRRTVHSKVVSSLRSGAFVLLEAYTPKQLEYKTGGPPVAEITMDSASLKSELEGLEFIELNEIEREIHEGQLHNGMGAVVQLIAHKP
ncbi:MAG: SAM-dependent methyltransferase [Gammaproteobacteria bacterium]